MSKLQKNRSKNSSVIETRLTGRSAVFSGAARGLPAAGPSVAFVVVDVAVSMVARAPDSSRPSATFCCKRVVKGSRITSKLAFKGYQLMKDVRLTRAAKFEHNRRQEMKDVF